MATKADEIQKYKAEYTRWLNILQNYHTRFNDNYALYTGKNDTQGTRAKISDPVAYELTERVVQKLFEREPKFFVETKGKNLPSEVKEIMTAVADWIWSNPDMVQSSGPMRSKLKTLGREFCVTGNAAIETFYNAQSDSPDIRVVPIEDIVFNPTKNLKTSPVRYIRQFVSLQYLKDNVEIKKDGKVVTGLFSSAAIKKLQRFVANNENQTRQDPSENIINRSGGNYERDVDKFQLISRWEGKHCVRFVMDDDLEDPIVVQEFDNDVLGSDPINVAMDTEVVKEPYSQSFIDELKGQFRLKNLFLNQMADYGSKVLNPPLFVDPAIGPVNMKTVVNAYKLGGVVTANPQLVDHKPISPLGNFGMEMLNWIEGRAESVSGINAYLAGTTNSAVDKTQGTAAGIQTLTQQAQSPVRDRQLNLEESIIEPFMNKALKMIGATMSASDVKWVLMTGEEEKMVKVTKGFLTGKIKLIDLMQAGVIDTNKPEGADELQKLVDLMMGEGKDPEKDLVFDVDWLVRVETGSLAETDSQTEVENKKLVLDTAIQLQAAGIPVPVDYEKLWKDIASSAGIKEPDQYLKKEEQNGQFGQGNPAAPTTVGGPQIPNMGGASMPTGNPTVGAGASGPMQV